MNTDPAEYQRASETPDMAAEIDTTEDLIREVATEQLRQQKKLRPEAEMMILPLITATVRGCIEVGTERGLFHNENSATFTPKFKEILVRILTEIHAHPNPRLYIDCLNFAFGLCLRQGMSQTSIADEHGVTRANVSKVTVQICQMYGVPPSRGMKPESAREVYRDRQMGKTAKPRAEEWTRGKRMKEAFQALRSA
jgi:hypothetical protein